MKLVIPKSQTELIHQAGGAGKLKGKEKEINNRKIMQRQE